MSEPHGAVALVAGTSRGVATARVLAVAVDLARRLDAELIVVHAVDLDDFPVDPDCTDWDEQARRRVEEERRLVADVLGDTAVRWSYEASRGEPAAVLADAATAHDALFVVVGAGGDGPGAALSRLLTPSTSHGLLHGTHRPVLIVPDGGDDLR